MIDIDIIEVTPEVNGWLYYCRYTASRGTKKARFYKDDIFKYLSNKYYEEGVREGNVENLFTKSLVHKDYKYIIAFLQDHHKI